MSSFTPDRIFRYIIGIALMLLTGWILYQFSNLVIYLIIALIITYALDPIVNKMEASGMNRAFSVILTIASLGLILIWISTNVFPIIAEQIVELAGQLNVENLQMIAEKVEERINRFVPFLPEGYLQNSLTQMAKNFFDIGQLPNALSNMIGFFTNVFSAVLVIPVAAFFFLKDGSKIRRHLLQLVPNKYFESSISLLDKIETRLGIYFRSVLLQSFLVGLSAWITLSYVGLNNSLSVGIAVGLANAIPYFGPVLGYFLSVIVSIIEVGDFSLVFECLLAILIVQALDNMLFQPLIFSRAANMHPVAILLIILVGAEIGGIVGMLLAIPVATVIRITINQINWCLKNYYVFRVSNEN